MHDKGGDIMTPKTNLGLVTYCKAQLGKPYWYGTFGHTATAALYMYNKKRLPDYYKDSDFTSQIGQRVHDCIGLVKGYLWSLTPTSDPQYMSNGCPDHSANSMLAACKEKGIIATIPNIPGTLVFMKDHIGVYIGGGQVIEARGHRYGVVQTELAKRPWRNWGKCPYLTYESEEEDVEVKVVTMMVNGVPTPIHTVNVQNENYVRLRDLSDTDTTDKLTATWDAQLGIPIIKTK